MDDEFPIEDLSKDVEVVDYKAIGHLIMAWARLDSLLSQLMLHSFGLSLDEGPILIGNMDTKTKIDRLIALYKHYGMENAAESMANLKKAHANHVDVRNALCHYTLVGTRASDHDVLVFSPVKVVPGSIGHMQIMEITGSGISRADKWAVEVGNRLLSITVPLALRRGQRPPEPPSFPRVIDPNRGKSSGKKNQSPRPKRRD